MQVTEVMVMTVVVVIVVVVLLLLLTRSTMVTPLKWDMTVLFWPPAPESKTFMWSPIFLPNTE